MGSYLLTTEVRSWMPAKQPSICLAMKAIPTPCSIRTWVFWCPLPTKTSTTATSLATTPLETRALLVSLISLLLLINRCRFFYIVIIICLGKNRNSTLQAQHRNGSTFPIHLNVFRPSSVDKGSGVRFTAKIKNLAASMNKVDGSSHTPDSDHEMTISISWVRFTVGFFFSMQLLLLLYSIFNAVGIDQEGFRKIGNISGKIKSSILIGIWIKYIIASCRTIQLNRWSEVSLPPLSLKI